MNFPFIATLIFLLGIVALLFSLFLSTWRFSRKSAPADANEMPDDFGPKLTSKRLRYVRWLFALLVVTAFGFHVYWGLFAAGPVSENKEFAHLKNTRDQRNRRDAEAKKCHREEAAEASPPRCGGATSIGERRGEHSELPMLLPNRPA